MARQLTDEEKAVIHRAAQETWYLDAPVPPELLEQLPVNFIDAVWLPPQRKEDLPQLYGVESGHIGQIQADWREALACGAVRMFDDNTISFPTHVQRSNGYAVEVSITRNADDDRFPWCLSYVPKISSLQLMRDVVKPSTPSNAGDDAPEGPSIEGKNAPAPASCSDDAASKDTESTIETTQAKTPASKSCPFDPLPPVLKEKIEAMVHTKDYRNGVIPEDVQLELAPLDQQFSAHVGIDQRSSEELLKYANCRLNLPIFLQREWKIAREVGAVRYYEGKLIFPVSLLRKDGRAIEVSFRKNDQTTDPKAKPWIVSYVDTYYFPGTIEDDIDINSDGDNTNGGSGPRYHAKPKANAAGNELFRWAYMGKFDETLKLLADLALDEKWDFNEDGESSSYAILSSYLKYTFYRLKTEGKVLEDKEQRIAAFNTGLVDKTYEPIYACFSPSTYGSSPWKLEAFCKAGSRQWGKRLVATFNPLPKRASYFKRKEDLLFDTERPLERDADHILLDNISRLPHDFLEEELRGSDEALAALEAAFSAKDGGARNNAFERLENIIENDSRIKRRLINRLDDAIELAQKRVEWNFKTAVPAFYPTKDQMSLLLPLDLTEDEKPDVALVVELTDSGAYIGQTILTMRMAYNNARMVCRPDSDWLNTSLRLSDAEEAARE